ncbi:exopolysaccharide biosynthesis polyprenyl glycosylphosphotransferase [Aliihoeflea sp. PC F10.4]
MFKTPPFEEFRHPSQRSKRSVDIVLAAIALVALLPLLLVIALAIKLDSRGPVLFRQRRGGLDGRPFAILKFRTLTVLEDGPSIRQIGRADSRVTRVGSFLRRTSLDELPQLFNVLTGDMSLVGPRPHALAHDEIYGQTVPNYSLRFAVKPGITGWAQVNGARGPTPLPSDMKHRVDFDVWYIEHWTFALDIRILVATAFAMLAGKMDAY